MTSQPDREIFERVKKSLPTGAEPSDMLWDGLSGIAGKARKMYLKLPEAEKEAVRRILAKEADLCGR